MGPLLVGPPKAGSGPAMAGCILPRRKPERKLSCSLGTKCVSLNSSVKGCMEATRLMRPFLFLHQISKQGELTMKENYGVIWTELIEIEELEEKIAPSGSWAGDDE